MDPVLKCPKCGESMEQGFTAARSESAATVTHWIEGQPQYGFFGGTKVSGKRQFAVQTFRCAKCGYLESYASSGGPAAS